MDQEGNLNSTSQHITWLFNDITIQASVQASAYDLNLNTPATGVHGRKVKVDIVHIHENKVDLLCVFYQYYYYYELGGKCKFNITAHDLAVK